MSCSIKNSGGEEGEYESKSVTQNGSITAEQFTIDENLLVDPKLLFIGTKIGEGAHGKVYEGRLVQSYNIIVLCLLSYNFSLACKAWESNVYFIWLKTELILNLVCMKRLILFINTVQKFM